ncbi:MAG TPA: fibronectin type III domain-containing protein [Candidatus Thermoplasmatota archaeon]|nr:fibronectin type III domain-containing protein [Candidatus Thermoplasmatota archaeon]
MSEVLGNVLMLALAVTMLGAFGAVVFSNVLSDTPTPPIATFTIQPENGAASVDIGFVGGSLLHLGDTTLVLQLDGGAAEVGAPTLAAQAVPGAWQPGETLTFPLTTGTLDAGQTILFMAVDKATGRSIGVAYGTVPGPDTAADIHENAIAATLAFDRDTLVADGVTYVNATVTVESTMGLILIDTVALDLTDFGGEGALALFDDGVAPDAIAGDGVFSARFVVSNYTFLSLPATAEVDGTATITDVLGTSFEVTTPLTLASPPASKVAAGVTFRNIGSSGIIGTTGAINLTAFSFRDAAVLDDDMVELRVNDLDDATRSWSALVSFVGSPTCPEPSVSQVILRRDGVSGSAVYTPASGCFPVGPDARIDFVNLAASVDDDGDTHPWNLVGSGSTFAYANAGIGSSNEAVISFFGDSVTAAPLSLGLGQADFTWAPPHAVVITEPESVSPLAATPGNAYVDLSWSAPGAGGSAITGYRIYKDGVLLATIGTNTTFRVNGLTNGQLYAFDVRAVNAEGEGPASSGATATPVSVAGAPTGLLATKGNQSVALNWGAPASNGGSAIVDYRIYAGTTSGATVYLGATGGANTSFIVRSLTNGQLYFFNVTAQTALGQGASSSQASATPSTLPYPPETFGATAGDARVTLSWTAGEDGGSAITDYDIYRGTVSGFATYLASTGGANTTFLDLTAINGLTYFYNVTARNANGVSASSPEDTGNPVAATTVPSAPESLSAERGNTTVTLSWAAPATDGGSSITTYRIWVGTSSGATTLLATTGGPNTTFTVNGLTNGVAYFFNVTAVNAVGVGPTSGEAGATPAGVPYPPSGLAATRGDRSASLSWSAPSTTGGIPITGYAIWQGSSSGGETLIATIGTNTSFVANELVNGQTYYYNVTAINAAGMSAGSNEATVVPATVPSAPAALGVTGGSGSATLTWTPASNGGSALTSYRIYVGTSSGGGTLVASTGSGANTSFVVNSLTNGVTYYFTVVAVNAVGDSAASNEVSGAPAAVPSAPGTLSATKGNQSVSLSWSAPSSNGGSAIVNYYVYRGTSSGGTTFLGATGGSNTTFVVNSLTNGQAYFFNVTAVNAVGQGSTSNEATATPSTTPNPPASLSATAGNAQVSLSWSAPASNGGSAITGYTIYRGTSSGGATFLATIGTNTSFVAAGLTNGQAYFFNVTAINANGQSSSSNEATATPSTTAGAPQSLSATKGDTLVQLSWSAPASNGGSAVTSYNIYRGTASGATTFLATTGGANTTFVVNSLTNGVAYFFNVTAVNANGQGATSAEATATPSALPSAPQSFSATRGNGSVALSWSAPSSNGGSAITGYNVYRGSSSGAATFLATIGTNTSFSDLAVTNGNTYFYNVTAVNANGQGASSSEASATPATIPNPPATFTATAGTSVSLSWTAGSTGGSAITAYQVLRSTSSGAETTLATIGTNTSYTDANVALGTTYYYTIKATNALGTSNPSVERSATPSSTPSAPQSASATRGNGSVALSWSAPSSTGGSAITAYTIYRSTSAGTETFLATIGTNTSYSDATVSNGNTYFYNVTASNANGQGASSSEVSATPATVPNPPATFSATAGSSVSLSWTAGSTGGSAITGYQIWRATSSGAEALFASIGTNTSYTDANVALGTTYYYTIKAVNAVGTGNPGVERSATPSSTPSAPLSPSATRGNASVALSWSVPSSTGGSAITGYTIYRGTSTGATTFLATIGTNTSYSDATVTNGNTYFYNVTASNANGQGASSSEVSATPAGVPFPPATFTATSGTTIGLSWTAGSTGGSAIAGYQILRSTSSGAETLLATIGTNTSYTDANVVASTTYFYTIKAVNAVGTGNPSVERSATAGTVPAAPTGLIANSANHQVALNWTAPSGSVTGYEIWRSTSSGAQTLLASYTGTNTTYVDLGLTNGTTYYYKVLAVNAIGSGALSSEASATPDAAMKVNCASVVQTTGTFDSCSALQGKDGVLAALQEGGSGSNKIFNMTFTINMTGVTGTQSLQIAGVRNNAAENLLIKALNAGTGAYDTIATLDSTFTTLTVFSGSAAASTYWPSGVLTIRLVDNGPDSNNSSWSIDYIGLVTT